ncbi:MAG: class I SAM-dependent methyltransferase [Thermodesulfovibrionia bacterium]|nr:class I SAM-dependent methyltransferase [Thermodesulfovibrionia bacterium]
MAQRLFKRTALCVVFLTALCAYALTGCAEQQKQHTSSSQGRFDDINRWVKVFENPERNKWQKPEEVIKKLNLKNGDVIADIGAGTGYFTRLFARAVAPEGKAIGLDIENSMVKYMEEDARKLNLKNYRARVVKPDDPELEPHSVDVIFICNTYHHIQQRVDYLRRLSKSLSANGRVVIVDFYKKPLPYGPPVDHKISKETVLKEFREAGYNLTRSLEFLPYQYFLEFAL